MKITDIYESTTAGSIATVAAPMSTQKRNGVGKGVYENEKAGNLLTGKTTNKKYANSVNEGAMVDHLFKAKYKNRETGETKEVNIRAASSTEAKEQAENHYTHNKSDWKCVSVKQVADEGRIVRESKMKELAMDNGNFQKKYKKSKEQLKHVLGDPDAKKTVHENDGPTKYKVVYFNPKLDRTITKTVTAKNESDIWNHCANKGLEVISIDPAKKTVQEAHLEEDDIIIVPGQGRSRKTGFIKHGESRLDHEVEMARSDLFSAAKNAKQVYELIADVTEEEGLEGWVQEKIIKANDYLNTIREYLEGKQLQNEMTGGVIAGGGVGEGRVDELSPALLSRAASKAAFRQRDTAKALHDLENKPGSYFDPEMRGRPSDAHPARKFWSDKADKFANAATAKRDLAKEKSKSDAATSQMSPAQKRKFTEK
jgi:hypothetical protein